MFSKQQEDAKKEEWRGSSAKGNLAVSRNALNNRQFKKTFKR